MFQRVCDRCGEILKEPLVQFGIKNEEWSCDRCLTLRLSFCTTFRCYEKFPLQDGLQRLPDCPLHQLPEKHGRLIDAKALDFAFTDLRFNDDRTIRHWDDRKNWCLHGSEVESLIENAETIVEAEGDDG